MSALAGLRCPLCGSGKTTTRVRMSMRDLETIYERGLNVRIKHLASGHEELQLLLCGECDLRFFVPPLEGDIPFYEALESSDWYYPATKSEFEVATRFIDPTAEVLEIGCGAGHFGARLRCRRYVGLELTPLAARTARAAGLNVLEETVQRHARERGSTYDVVCAFQVLEHVAEPSDFLRSALAMLQPGGLLIVSVPSADSYVARAPNNCLNLPPHHLTWWSDKVLENVAGILQMTLVHLEHELLADEHVEAYAHTLLMRALGRHAGAESVIDRSLRGRIVSRAATLAAPLVKRGILGLGRRPPGHSVTAVYRRS